MDKKALAAFEPIKDQRNNRVKSISLFKLNEMIADLL